VRVEAVEEPVQCASEPARRRWPLHGWLGLALVGVFWTLNWSLSGLRSHWAFFPLWLGFSLTVDALALARTGTSMLTRSPGGYVMLFLISAPGWWLFEILNLRTQNWRYEGVETFRPLPYFLLCSWNFSTVMPAVFGTAEVIGSSRWLRRMGRGPVLAPTPTTAAAMFVTGWLMLALLLAWPLYFFPFLWGAVYLIIEPVNIRLGNRSLLEDTATGNWQPPVALSLGCLICGVFWEMWNYYSYPKWVYHVPFVGVLHVFEMPLLGYLGYLVFAWELHALYHLITGPFGRGASVLVNKVLGGSVQDQARDGPGAEQQ
jgi:hypothetical protein